MIPRFTEKSIFSAFNRYKKAVIILGARQVGKTTLILDIQKKLRQDGEQTLYLNCDLEEDRNTLNTTSITRLEQLVKNINYLFIDEAYRLDQPGLTIKILADNFPETKLVITGSSSFELKNQLSDALTGRYIDFTLFPFSLTEILQTIAIPNKALLQEQANAILDGVLLYGFYPDIYLAKTGNDKRLFLEKIIESYLFKDISWGKIRNPKALRDLASAIAYQIGSEINESELASRLKIDRKTVINYLDILEKSFVIIRLFPFSKNPRREIGKNYKIYFTDLGIRNALIGDFNPINIRSDHGGLWENFLFIERLKLHKQKGIISKYYFWRSYGGAEVDYIEKVSDSQTLRAFEFKISGKAFIKTINSFKQEYNSNVEVINKNNYLDFIF